MPDTQDCPKPYKHLARRIKSREATVAVIGLGYVGLPMVQSLFRAGFRVVGIDSDPEKIEQLERGESYLGHVDQSLAPELAASDRFSPTEDTSALQDVDVVVICVPTPLGPHREPDLSFIETSMRAVLDHLRPGQLVILTSTTYPGTTRDVCLPILQESGLQCGRDFFLAFCPEREDPGRGQSAASIPRVVGGVDEKSGELAASLFRNTVNQVHTVASAEVAEASKLLENIYRAVNIALVNELKVLFQRLDIDIWQVIEAASTKPFGFQPFFPGPGLGGHCIPIDPFYMTWKAKEVGLSCQFIELAGEVNTKMPEYVVQRVASALNDDGKALRSSRIFICGVAYKPNVGDVRETPAVEIIERLSKAGAHVSYHDPHVPTFPKMRKHHISLSSTELSPRLLERQDCVLILTQHASIDWASIGEHSKLIVDTRNVMVAHGGTPARVVKA